jgi:Flp pilus assembly protein TadG
MRIPEGVAVKKPGRPRRRGAAAVELALLLPLLTFLLLMTIDYARLFYHYTTITNCARNGAIWASDPTGNADSPYTTLYAAVNADGSGLNPAISSSNVTQASGTDANGAYVEVTVRYDFNMLTSYASLGPQTTTLTRTVRMRVAPATPG